MPGLKMGLPKFYLQQICIMKNASKKKKKEKKRMLPHGKLFGDSHSNQKEKNA